MFLGNRIRLIKRQPSSWLIFLLSLCSTFVFLRLCFSVFMHEPLHSPFPFFMASGPSIVTLTSWPHNVMMTQTQCIHRGWAVSSEMKNTKERLFLPLLSIKIFYGYLLSRFPQGVAVVQKKKKHSIQQSCAKALTQTVGKQRGAWCQDANSFYHSISVSLC